ncbi:Alpha/Beta hydrolase protein [Mycena maculata]|uniref:Alpha/Beta hydrolase protein n=1 Tax=Mycena maculata TaxID=230809 RepID=A0AAD7JFL2_9AGAR|nr:Alpha/Beta hydrolase protein [Mycena maculata]
MFEGFQPFTVTTQSDPKVDIYGLKSGDASSSLPPLLLLHGAPQTHHIWHRVAPQITSKYTVILMDLRGYGQSSKPEPVAAYAKSAMAGDCIGVMDALGFDSFFVCAHDRGARVTHKLCVDHPTRVRKAVLLDICPTLAMFEATNFDFAKAYWHWFFMAQAEPLPETLIRNSGRQLAGMWFGGGNADGVGSGGRQPECGTFDPRCFEVYAKGLESPETVHGMCNDYRAGATLDLEEQRTDLAEGRRIRSPLVVLWGKYGVIEKSFDAVKEWKAVSDEGVDVQGFSVDSGHFLPEQVPEDVVGAIVEFLV